MVICSNLGYLGKKNRFLLSEEKNYIVVKKIKCYSANYLQKLYLSVKLKHWSNSWISKLHLKVHISKF